MTPVTRENGSSRDPYPPTTVSLLTNPRFDFRSARTTRISNLYVTNSRSTRDDQTHVCRPFPRGKAAITFSYPSRGTQPRVGPILARFRHLHEFTSPFA